MVREGSAVSDEELRRLERRYKLSLLHVDRDRLLNAGRRTGKRVGWAIELMGGPSFDDLLWWRSPVSLLYHLVRPTGPDRSERGSELLCGMLTSGLFQTRHQHPLHLQWATQDDVHPNACDRCMREALRRYHVDHRSSILLPQVRYEPIVDRTRIAGWLGRYQAEQWGRWHPSCWPLPFGLDSL